MNQRVLLTITWAARVLGLLLVIALLGVIVYSFAMIRPETEENLGYFLLILVCVALAIFLSVFLMVGWRRELTGGISYLVFTGILVLAILFADIADDQMSWLGTFYLYFIPMGAAGLLFLISGLMKKAMQKVVSSAYIPED